MLRINHAILHVFDFTSCVNVFSQGELDLESRLIKGYVSKHVKKAFDNIDNKRGELAPDSMFASELQAYFAGERNFVDLSVQIAEFVTASFEGRVNRYFGIFLLESRQAFMHSIAYGEDGQPCNEIERHHAILPNPSQKISSFAVINMRSMEVAFQDKKRVIAGEERYLIPDGLLQCSMQASSKEVIDELTRIVEEVATEYGADPVVSLSKAKAYVCDAAEEGEEADIAPFDLAQEVFEDEPLRERFVACATEEQLPERVRVEKKAAERITRNHKIRTDTGIEITFPSEYANNPDFIEFASTPNGLISIELKNIGHIENRR